MKTFSIDRIIIPPDRHRQEFDPAAMLELRESIETFGLLHPLVVRQGEDGTFLLVAGERRLRAIRDIYELSDTLQFGDQILSHRHIPVTMLSDLLPRDIEAIELEENIRRVDLTWQERANALARLHSIRSNQAEEKGLHYSSSETAEELGTSKDTVRRSIIVSEHLDNPTIANARSVDDAYRLLKREEFRTENESRARSGTIPLSRHRAIHGDAIAEMSTFPPESFDIILTDPPYGMGADGFGDSAGRTSNFSHNYTDLNGPGWTTLMEKFFPEAFRVAKPQSHLYLFCDIDRFELLKIFAEDAGWWTHRTPLIHFKPDGSRVPWPEHGPRRQWEMILYAVKGKRPTVAIKGDVIESRMTDPTFGHGAQKPVSLYRDLLSRSARPGDTVLDPFMGTGTIFPAADSFGATATGIEQSAEYFGISLTRLETLE